MWSIRIRKPDTSFDPTSFHDYLILSQERSTMILTLGEELQELENSQFYTSGPTIFAGTVMDNQRMVQIYASGLRLLDQGFDSLLPFPLQTSLMWSSLLSFLECNLVQEVPIPSSSHVSTCSVEGDYILLQLSNNEITLLSIDHEQKKLSFERQPESINVFLFSFFQGL